MSRLKKQLTKYINDHLDHPDVYSEITKKANLQKNKKENLFTMKKSPLKIVLPCLLGLIIVFSIVLVVSLTETKTVDAAPVGIVQMDVNPSISLVVDSDGKVVSIYGENDEGKMMLQATSYTGKSLEVVIEEIIKDEEKTGYLVSINAIDEKNIKFSIEGSSEVVSSLEEKINTTVTKVCDELNINEKLEIVKTNTKDALIKRARELDPTLSADAADSKTTEELLKYIAGCQLEKATIPTEELEQLYDQLKEEKINIVERAETKKVIDALDSSYQAVINKYDSLYNALNDKNASLDELYYNNFIKEDSLYQINLLKMQEAKQKLLVLKSEIAKMDDSDPLKIAKQAELTIYTNAYDAAEELFEEVKNKAFDAVNAIKDVINATLEEMDKIKEELPSEIKTTLNENLSLLEDELNKAKAEAFNEFEEKYKEELEREIKKAKDYKASLVNNLKK